MYEVNGEWELKFPPSNFQNDRGIRNDDARSEKMKIKK